MSIETLMNILIVEDNEPDQLLLQEAFKIASSGNAHIDFVEDGQKVMDFLSKRNEFKDLPTPDLILLDLNIPKKDGRSLLAEIKAEENLRHIPILILTSSRSDNDVRACYRLGANGYILKPSRFPELLALVKAIHDFWLTKVIYPVPA